MARCEALRPGTRSTSFGHRLTNWAGNYTYSTANVHRLASIEQVRAFVKRHNALRVLGTRHCFNGIADSPHALISLEAMRDVVLDEKAHTVTVEAGVTYGRLCPLLHQKGFALHNLASLPHISIAGTCATATHGSGIKQGNLATAVSALELVTANGDLLTLSRTQDGDTFLGAVKYSGALGVMTRVTLDVQPDLSDEARCIRGSPAGATGRPFRGDHVERLQRQPLYRLAELAD